MADLDYRALCWSSFRRSASLRHEIGIHAYRGQSDAISCTRGLHRICDNPPFDEQILTLGN